MTRRLSIPRGAWPIVDRHLKGAEPSKRKLVVSFVGEHDFEGETVHCTPGVAYEWAWVWGRSVIILVKPGIDATQAVLGIFRWSPGGSRTGTYCPVLVDVESRQAAHVVQVSPRLMLEPATLDPQ